MKLKQTGRAALLACASLALALGISSCASSTLGYLFATVAQYGQIASLRLDINSGAIKSVNCNTHNSDQQNCNVGGGGSTPTKLVLANGNSFMYVLNVASASNTTGSVSLFTLGPSGSVYATGQSYQSSGRNPVDMYLSPAGGYLYVLDQFRPQSDTNAGCQTATPTPQTCPGDITVFSIDGKGNLNVILNTTNNIGSNQSLRYFPTNYIPDPPAPLTVGAAGNHLLAASGYLYLLDDGTPGVPQVDSFQINGGQLGPSNGTAATTNANFVTPIAIVAGLQVYIADYSTGQVWIYNASNGALTSPGGVGYICPAQLASGTAFTNDPAQNVIICQTDSLASSGASGGQNIPVALTTLLTDPTGKYLYSADYNNGVTFSDVSTGAGSTGFSATSNGGGKLFGAPNATCLTITSGTEFLYESGQGNISGIQIDTSTGNLTTNEHTTSGATFTGDVPCLVFSSRT